MASAAATRRRVVVTGLGAVTPLGLSMVDSWRALVSSHNDDDGGSSSGSGLTDLPAALRAQGSSFLTPSQLERELALARQLRCQVAAPVRGLVSADRSRAPRFAQMALRAAGEALARAGLRPPPPRDGDGDDDDGGDDGDGSTTGSETTALSLERTGVSIGSGMSGVREIAQAVLQTRDDGDSFRRLSPHFVPRVLGNSAASRVALRYRLRGPNLCAATACAAGAHALGEAARCIASDQADAMLAGGAEACLDPWSLAGFGRLRALSTRFNDTPRAASRPFDAHRDGFVMGEGAAVLVLEELQHALRRLETLHDDNGTRMPTHLVELIGYGATGDAHHITAPDPDGDGAVRAMQMALRDAQLLQLDGDDGNSSCGNLRVQYVNAHATSTPKGDEIEARAIHEALCAPPGADDDNNNVWVSSTKGHTGHLLGAAGAVEAAFTVQSLLDQCLPATANLQDVGDDGDDRQRLSGLRHVRGPALRVSDYNLAMSNSFGFGGTNASLLFRRIKL